MKLIRRDPSTGYIDSLLWVPKSQVNVDGVKSALTFSVNDKRQMRFLQLFRETPHHLLVPREFWDPETLPFPVVDGRPRSFARTGVKSKITLDFKTPSETTQRDAVQSMQDSRGGILQLACGKGKAQPVDTPVLTPLGWVPIGSLKEGSCVIGSDGKAKYVSGVFPQGKLPVYRVTMEDGTSTLCCAEHLWFTQTPSDRRRGSFGEVRSLRTIHQTLRTKAGAQHAIPRTSAIHFVPDQIPFSPWLMGVYLGDGNSGVYNGQKRLQFHKGNDDLHQKIWKDLSFFETEYSFHKDKRTKNKTTNVLFGSGDPVIWVALEEYGLIGLSSTEKFIPKVYFRATIEDRWDLLDGLLATDGSITPTARTFSTSSQRLKDDVVELARSLGVRVTVEERQTYFTYLGKRKPGSPSWRLYLSHDRWGIGRYNNKQYIQSVEPEGEADCVCIKVDSDDHLYVTENYIVTHNTVCALELIAREKVPAIIVVDNTHLVGQWKESIEQFLEVPGGIGMIGDGQFDWKKEIVISTYQTLSQKVDDFPQEARNWFGLVIWDEAHHMAAPTWAKTADLFYGKRIGLTATPERADGTHVIYDFHIGKVLYKDLVQELKPSIFFYWTNLDVDLYDQKVRSKVCDINGELHTSMLYGYFGQWRERLDLILAEVRKAERQGRRVLVLSYSIAELINLFSLWNGSNALYTDLAYPTAQEVGETVAPQPLGPKLKKMLARKHQLLAALKDTTRKDSYSIKIQLKDVDYQLKANEVHEKCELEFGRRQREFLKEALKNNSGNAGIMIGDVKLEQRMKMLREKQIVFAIMKYGREGLDEQSLDTVFVCEPMSQKNGLQQLMGRVLRKKAGKKTPVVVFFEDNIGPMIGMCSNLRRHLRTWPHEEGGPFHYEHVNHPNKGTRKTWATL